MHKPQIMAAESAALRRAAERAATSAAADLLDAFRSPIDVDFKRDPHDVVTAHDRSAEVAIRSMIDAEVQDSRFLGEESGETGTGRVLWIIDPIDGTANFARGLAYWCVSIAAAVDDQVVAGVVFDPVARNLFSADLDGAWHNGSVMRSCASPRSQDATMLTSFPSAYDLQLLGPNALPLLSEMVRGFRHVHSLGSGALNLAHVAAGWADATMGFATKPWDIAAGAFVLEQSGGRFSGYTRGRPRRPNHWADDYIATGDGADYGEITDSIARVSGDREPHS